MWIISGIFLMLAWIAWMEIPNMWRGRRFKELCVISAFALLISVLGLLVGLQRHLPNPLDWIEMMLGPYPQAVYSLFK